MKQRLERGRDMKKNKGFTLIELLAVIVILAIIALIAVPVVMNIINKSNKSAFKDSAYGIIKAGELFYTDKLLETAGIIEETTFTFPNDIEGLEIKGSKPTGGNLVVNNKGQISMAITNGKYCITKDFEDDDVTITDDNGDCKLEVTSIGDAVYYNPNEAKLCTEAEWNSNEDKNGKSGCMRWYIYGIEGNKQKLILDHNTTNNVVWISEEDYLELDPNRESDTNSHGPVTLMKQLKDDTADWKIKADIVDALDLIKIIPYFQKLEDINTWELHWEEEYIELYAAAIEESLDNVPQSEYTSVDAYLDAILDYAEENHSNVMLPSGLYYDLMYEYVMQGLTGEELTTYGYWTKTAYALDSNVAWSAYLYYPVYIFPTDTEFSGLRPVITLSK